MAKVGLRDRRYLVHPGEPSAEPFRSLRLAVELRPDARSGNTILFTSPRPGEGKSTIAANYALVAAQQRHVLLVDADLRNPSLHQFFEVPRAPGLVEALGSGGDVSELVHTIPSSDRLALLTVGSEVRSAGDIAASSLMANLLEHVRRSYDLVVIDAPPVLVAADAAGLASHPGTDVVVVVNRSGKRRPLVRVLRKLELTGANVLGVVVNRDGRLAPYAY